jgi:hypothetical protein
MSHMIAYLGGDSHTLAVRRAIENDVRLAVEFPTERKMLVICVMQTGEIIMSWDDISGSHPSTHRIGEMYVVGQLVSQDNGISHELRTDLESLTDEPATIHYFPLQTEK